jgi:hypothetical protein
MATATAEKSKGSCAADLAALLSDGDAPLSDALSLVGEPALAAAWSRGEVEFGRQTYTVSGRPGAAESKPTLYVEDGVTWTGERRAYHKGFSALLADLARVPDCTEYRKYVRQVCAGKDETGMERWRTLPADDTGDGQEVRWATKTITRDEAAKALAPRVRLTDKGVGAA